MGKLSTHVLDTSLGKPAQGLKINLYKRESDKSLFIKSVVTNADGRCDKALLTDDDLQKSGYELEFLVEEYFQTKKQNSSFLKDVILRFYVENVNENYHVPLLITPFSYSTYRGS